MEGTVFVKKIFLYHRWWTHLQSGITLKSMADPQWDRPARHVFNCLGEKYPNNLGRPLGNRGPDLKAEGEFRLNSQCRSASRWDPWSLSCRALLWVLHGLLSSFSLDAPAIKHYTPEMDFFIWGFQQTTRIPEGKKWYSSLHRNRSGLYPLW